MGCTAFYTDKSLSFSYLDLSVNSLKSKESHYIFKQFLQKCSITFFQNKELFVTHQEKKLSQQQITATTCAVLAFVECSEFSDFNEKIQIRKTQLNALWFSHFIGLLFDPKTPTVAHTYFYRPSMKLREGNVLTLVCLSIQRWASHVFITHNALDLTGPLLDMGFHWTWIPPPLAHGISLHRDPLPLLVTSGDHYWRPVQIFHLRTPLPVLTSGCYWSTYSRCKQAVGILLDILVQTYVQDNVAIWYHFQFCMSQNW